MPTSVWFEHIETRPPQKPKETLVFRLWGEYGRKIET